MTARRDFLKGAAASGIFFCGCALLRAAQAQSSTARALPVMVNGKRVKTIDVHSHCHFHEAVNLMGEEAKSVLPQTKGAQEHFIVIEERLKGMDAQAIDMEVLSINPFWYRKERDTAAAIVKVQNEKLAELCASRPDRFAAFTQSKSFVRPSNSCQFGVQGNYSGPRSPYLGNGQRTIPKRGRCLPPLSTSYPVAFRLSWCWRRPPWASAGDPHDHVSRRLRGNTRRPERGLP
jgi:hypothetical protein